MPLAKREHPHAAPIMTSPPIICKGGFTAQVLLEHLIQVMF
jgi:hypothetical protein